tara:strand:+ start:1560 stop:1709 length:150 start_codon:yes stop_codon:yes gene_type:complete
MGLSQYKKPLMFMFAGAVVFGVLASQTGLLGKIGNLPSKVTDSISNVSA